MGDLNLWDAAFRANGVDLTIKNKAGWLVFDGIWVSGSLIDSHIWREILKKDLFATHPCPIYQLAVVARMIEKFHSDVSYKISLNARGCGSQNVENLVNARGV